MDHRLRPATPQDLKTVLGWLPTRDAVRLWGGARLPDPLPEDVLEVWTGIKGDAEHCFALVDPEGRLAGFGQAFPRESGTVFLARLAIAPECRGRGLGRLLCLLLMERAAAHPQAREFALKVYPENTPALRLYRSLGFQECPAEPGSASLLMKCPIAEAPRSLSKL